MIIDINEINNLEKNSVLVTTNDIKVNKKYDNITIYKFDSINDFYKFINKNRFSNSLYFVYSESIYEYYYLYKFLEFYSSELNCLKKEIKKFNNSIIDEHDNKIIKNSLNKFISLNCDGKFIRGCLIKLGYKLKCNDNYSKYLSIAYETFETSILIHDDIIDNAVLRRGKATISKSYYDELNVHNSNVHNDLALCIGDIGFYYSNELINKKYSKDKNFSKLLSYYNNIVINTIKGEILDVYLPYIEKNNKDNILNEDDILEIYKLKTSCYSVVGPFVLGMILAGCKNSDIKKFENILMDLGIAFQIKDDILGVFSSKDILGKSVYSDIEEFKQTILYSYIKINKKDYYDDLMKYYGKKNITSDDALNVQKIIIDSGSYDYACKLLKKLFNNFKNSIKNMNINNDVKEILLGFSLYLEIRDK